MQQNIVNFIKCVRRNRACVHREEGGDRLTAVLPVQEMRRVDQVDLEREERFEIIDVMRAAFRDVPIEEIEREADRSLAEVRAEMRAEREATSDSG